MVSAVFMTPADHTGGFEREEIAMWTILRRMFSSAGWFGDLGERAAAGYLRRRGYRILQRQFRNRFGEIDLIALNGETIVFVEVKTRRGTEQGAPFEAVSTAKQQKLTKTALAYLKRKKLLERRYQFDVVSIVWRPGEAQPEIQHFPHAFESTGQGQMYA